MKAVDSEFKTNLSNDARRIYQLFRSSIVKKGCPLNSFGTGNLGTLIVPKTYEKLL
jgi:secreted Zn-dependent insulinase-like peptidase